MHAVNVMGGASTGGYGSAPPPPSNMNSVYQAAPNVGTSIGPISAAAGSFNGTNGAVHSPNNVLTRRGSQQNRKRDRNAEDVDPDDGNNTSKGMLARTRLRKKLRQDEINSVIQAPSMSGFQLLSTTGESRPQQKRPLTNNHDSGNSDELSCNPWQPQQKKMRTYSEVDRNVEDSVLR
ncbi:hypothetical protein N431DRAFT_465672 [Stipitochalara longipes BDJ]|nr:hypothetical protein N431DRAFT_465672 [Stipitochalara longipes BDJ]